MTKGKAEAKAERKRYSAEFKQQALLRAVKDGVSVTARDLGLPPAQLYAWRGKAQQRGQDAEAQQLMQSEQALFNRKMPRGVVMHTDRGSQYCSREHHFHENVAPLLDGYAKAMGVVASRQE